MSRISSVLCDSATLQAASTALSSKQRKVEALSFVANDQYQIHNLNPLLSLANTLVRLELVNHKISNQGINVLMKLRNLTYLNVDGCGISTGLLFKHDRLKTLFLGANPLEPDDLSHLSGNTSLTTLYLDHIPTMRDEVFRFLSLCSSLKYVNFNTCSITNEGLSMIPDHISNLNLSNNASIDDTGLSHLASNKTLSTVDLSYTTISDAGLSTYMCSSALTSLNISDTICINAASLAGLKNLRVLNLSSTEIQNLESLISNNKKLTAIDLSLTQVASSVVAQLVSGLENLTELNLMGCPMVNDEAAAALFQSPSMKNLNLYATNVTDKGMSGLATNQTIRILTIGWSDYLSDLTVEYVLTNRSLYELCLSNCKNISEGAKEKLLLQTPWIFEVKLEAS
jgi:hypothetical protein